MRVGIMMILINITITIRIIGQKEYVQVVQYNIQALTITFVIVKYKLDEPILYTPRIILFTATSKRTKSLFCKRQLSNLKPSLPSL